MGISDEDVGRAGNGSDDARLAGQRFVVIRQRSYEEAVTNLGRVYSAGGPLQSEKRQVEADAVLVSNHLRGGVLRRVPEDVGEVATQEWFVSVITDARKGKNVIVPGRNASAYANRRAWWKALQELRRSKVYTDHTTAIERADSIAASLAETSDSRVKEALHIAYYEAEDYTAFRVVSQWLNLAAKTGETPRTGDVAKKLGWSRPVVAQAMQRFREYSLAHRSSGGVRTDEPGRRNHGTL